MSRESQSDSTTKKNPRPQTKAGMAYQMTWPNPLGEWAPAYGGGMGVACDPQEEINENEG